ncbi:MAG: helix-turn-helix domain-containing protein [Burkholderiales bacterium]
MPDSFGVRLRRQRETRRIDLGSIAEQTKIKVSLLEGLERGDVSHWPSGIFRRAYIRTYAHIIGLDPDAVLREFLEAYPEPPDAFAVKEAAALEEAARRNAPPPTRLRTIVDSAIDSLSRLRRPGVTEEQAGMTRALTPPTMDVEALEGAPQPHAADVEDTVELEVEMPGTFPPRAAALSIPDDAPQRTSVRPPDEATMRIAAEETGEPSAPLLDLAAREDPIISSSVEDEAASASAARTSDESRYEAVADLCTGFGRAGTRDDILRLLEVSARTLDATGVIVWIWDESSDELRPVLVHGYSEKVLAYLPTVRRDADNATAAAFRSSTTCEVAASAQATGALVVPLQVPEGCVGVLAVELQPGIQPSRIRRANATILAAAVAQLVYRSQPLARRSHRDRVVATSGASNPLIRPGR